jgi:hypothetical protein
VLHVREVAACLADELVSASVEPRPDPSSTLSFLSAGLNSSTMSRFELKPPVATMTALLEGHRLACLGVAAFQARDAAARG